MTRLDDDLHKLIGLFEEAELNQRDSRQLALRDRDYYDNKQWTSNEVATLKDRKQPITTINRIKPKVDLMLGLESQTRNDPKAFARTPEHEADSAVVTDVMRYLDTRSKFDEVRTAAFENFAIEGTACGKIEVNAIKTSKGKIKDFDVKLKYLHWDRVFWDPHARLKNMSDGRFRGEAIFLDVDEAKALYPKNHDVIDEALVRGGHGTSVGDLFEDAPQVLWADTTRKRIRIVEMWYRVGQEVWYAVFSQGGFIEPPKRSPYKNDMGADEDPYEFRSSFVDREGARYGHVRQLVPIQDEINKRRSKALHLMSVRQVRFARGSDLDTAKVRGELARPDGIIRADEGEFEVLPTADLAQAQFALLDDAQRQIDAVGTNAALQGKQEGSASGKALQARSSTGAIEVSPLFDGIRSWQRDMYSKAWNRVREYWTEEKYIRVTDQDDSVRFILLNRDESRSVPGQGSNRDDVTSLSTPLADLDVDIIIREGSNDILAQQEQFVELTRMAASGVPIPMEALIELSSLRPALKEKILKGMTKSPEVEAQEAQIQQQVTALELAQKAADVKDTQASAAKKEAEAGNKQQDQIIKQVKRIEDINL